MKTDKKVPDQSGRIMKMTKQQAAFSIGEVFCIVDKADEEIREGFLKALVDKLANHSVSCKEKLYAEAIFPDQKIKGSFTVSAMHYDDKDLSCRMLWMVNSIAGIICHNDKYKEYFQPHIKEIFTEDAHANSFVNAKARMIEIQKPKLSFNIFKTKNKAEKILEENEANTCDLLMDDAFTEAISWGGEGRGFEALKKRVRSFSMTSMPLHEEFRNEKIKVTNSVTPIVINQEVPKSSMPVPALVQN